MKYTFATFVLLITLYVSSMAQKPKDNLLQFSGIVLTSDSLSVVPFVNIYVKNTGRGTMSDIYGFFSFVAKKGDEISFSYMGFKTSTFIIPDTIIGQHFSMIKLLINDTLHLSETIIYPWPTKEQFKEAFLKLKIPDDQIEIARKNFALAQKRAFDVDYKMDGSMNFRNYVDQQTSKLYYIGQQKPISLFNPMAWAQFIKAWKNGDFKRKDD